MKLSKTKIIILLFTAGLIGIVNLQGQENVLKKEDYPQHCIQTGVQQGWVWRIQEGIDGGASIHDDMYNDVRMRGYKPMHDACARGHLEVVKFLVEKGADINVQDSRGPTPLMSVVENNWQIPSSKQLEIINFLLNHEDIDIDLMEKAFDCALCWQGKGCKRDPKIAEIIARKKPDFSLSQKSFSDLKYLAERSPNKGWHQLFVRFDEETYKFDSEHDLYYAVKAGDIVSTKILLDDVNTDVNFQDKHGNTALMIACQHGHIEIVKLLLQDERTALEIKKENGRTAFDMLCDTKLRDLLIYEKQGKFTELYNAIILNDLDKVTEIVERSNYFGYWGSCTPNKKLALLLAGELESKEIYQYLCKAWNVPADDDSWKSTAVNVMEWLCYLHPDGK